MKPPFPPITIWIHGTYPGELVPDLVKRMQPEAVNRFFYCKPGLHKIGDLDPAFHTTQLLRTLSQADPTRFPADHFYQFGWSGALDSKAREQAARDLFLHLQTLHIDYLAQYGTPPVVRIITHSHGGNVALNLAQVGRHIHIDELILLACPVQQETARFIGNPFFKKIYSIHSHVDMIQVLDPQGLPDFIATAKKMLKTTSLDALKTTLKSLDTMMFFSGRHFASNPHLIQIKISLDGRSPLHIEFLLDKFIQKLPVILDTIAQWEVQGMPKTSSDGDVALDIKG